MASSVISDGTNSDEPKWVHKTGPIALRSGVWRHFKEKRGEKMIIKCDHCPKVYKYTGSTTALRNHLKSFHHMTDNDIDGSLSTPQLGVPHTQMGSFEKFCLKREDFEVTLSRSFAGIRESKHFLDCTLISDDEEGVYSDNLQAHKVILSACSEFFRNILTKESICAHSNPLIYLKGICTQDLNYALDFMYNGEVNVARDELDRFLEVADTLKITGLTKGSRATKGPVSSKSFPPDLAEPYMKATQKLSAAIPSLITKLKPEAFIETEDDHLVSADAEDLEESIRGNDKFFDSHEDYREEIDGEYEEDIDTDIDVPSGTGDRAESDRTGIMTEDNYVKITHKAKHLTATEKITLVNIIKSRDKEHILRKRGISSKRDTETTEKRKMLWAQILPAFNEICGTNYDIKKLKDTLHRIKKTPRWKSHSLLYDDLPSSARGEDKDNEPNGYKGKHLSATERLTLVKIIKILDKEYILRVDGNSQRDPKTLEKRKVLWTQIVPAFNEICGINCDVQKLKDTLRRIKRTTKWKSHSLLYDDMAQ